MFNKFPNLVIVYFILCGLIGCTTLSETSKRQAPTAKAETVKPESDYEGSYIRRPTIVVRDMDEALSLYRDILGLEVGRVSQDPPQSYVYTAFNIPKGTRVMHATLNTDKDMRVLSIVAVENLQRRNGPNDIRTSAILINANGRLAEIRTQLIEQGYNVLSSHKLGKTGTEFGFIDRDGHLITMYEFPKP